MSQSDKRLVSNFANEMEKLNSLASIDSKEMIIEGSNNEYKG
uniref:Bm13340 n=1 Tax=Brugia malayi TaxID=6279 RepID=A0A0J9YAQ0_BRUMA|nr:Bm13340 [Brugia malayi]